MDLIAHGLWTSVVYWKERRREWFWGIFFGMFPDLIAFGPFLVEEAHSHGQPLHPYDPALIPTYVYTMYHVGHSLVVWGAVFFCVWLLRGRRPWWPLAGWALHVLLDIPTHALGAFSTPFLFPFSSLRFDGVPWSDPLFMIVNWSAIVIVYGVLFIRYRLAHKARHV